MNCGEKCRNILGDRVTEIFACSDESFFDKNQLIDLIRAAIERFSFHYHTYVHIRTQEKIRQSLYQLELWGFGTFRFGLVNGEQKL